jgi:hypothetical protein
VLPAHLSACRFFIYVAYLFLLHQMGTALFRLMGALGREINRTNMFGSFILVLLILLSGFALKRPDIHPWWIWVSTAMKSDRVSGLSDAWAV